LADVVKLTYFVCDLSAVPVIRAAAQRVHRPGRPAGEHAGRRDRLVLPDLLIEVEAVALAPS
jgi:enamine deaminase RidA (YjgF/YER057c/UK114 family)